jgi:hypothetical protein
MDSVIPLMVIAIPAAGGGLRLRVLEVKAVGAVEAVLLAHLRAVHPYLVVLEVTLLPMVRNPEALAALPQQQTLTLLTVPLVESLSLHTKVRHE